jgi:putative thioredoxin
MQGDGMVVEVGPGQFEQRVVAASRERAVVVDFWAEWCAPCRSLGPALEDVVRSYEGRVILAKVNVDECPQVAARYGVRGIPAVKVFRDAEVVGEFVGALPRPEVERVLGSLLPSSADELVSRATRLLQDGDIEEAEELYRQALQDRPDHSGALFGLGALALETGRRDEAEETLSRIEENAEEYAIARGLLAGIEFDRTCREAGGIEECRRRVQADPDDLDARYELACCLAAEENYEQALEEFLGILSVDRNYRDQAPREAMLRIFSVVGPRGELANNYRRRLAAALY